jgi:hypothetical protein
MQNKHPMMASKAERQMRVKGMKDLFGDVPYHLPEPEPQRAFDGETYDPKRDYIRLSGQLAKVFEFMSDGKWHTLRQIVDACGGSEAAVSARLRDLRKKKYGGYTVLREHLQDGLHRYRLMTDAETV